ncbi:MAG: glycosyltransferase [Methyloprofundus sp.]|nr:glycosyltransferase [Methyloprofundus sp.]
MYELIQFVDQMTTTEFINYFWAFIFFDLIRYVLTNGLLLFYYIPKKILSSDSRAQARRALYKELPLVSVLVPGKNEGKHIPRLAESLTEQNYSNYELIIVDDGSDDDTEIICRQLEKDKKIAKFIRNDERGGKASAANTALSFSKGKYIVHIDADSHLASDTIETILLAFYTDKNIGAVGGDVRVANIFDSLATRLQAIEYAKSISTGRTISSLLGVLRIISGAHGAFRRDILERLGGWDVGPGLDGDITLKIRKLGYRVVHEPDAICYTNTPVKFSKLARQRFRWDRSMVRFRMRKHLDILLPSKGFNLLNFVAVADNVFFNVVLNFKWWFYIIHIFILSANAVSDILVYIIAINYFFYVMANIIDYITVCLLYGRRLDKSYFILFMYLPLIPFYTGIFLRAVRTYAYLMELIFKVSFNDKWNPWKVSKIAKEEGL